MACQPRAPTAKLSGRSYSCGRQPPRGSIRLVAGSQYKDITGQRFGRLVAVEYVGQRPCSGGRSTQAYWRCACDCGGSMVTAGTYLRTGKTVSCGCKNLERLRARRTHGNTPEYRCWHAMVGRCTRPSHPNWRYYGGRGITVCERWLSFDNFLTDMGKRPSMAHSIDRADNNRGYEPGNCQWATKAEQMTNRRHCPTCTCI